MYHHIILCIFAPNLEIEINVIIQEMRYLNNLQLASPTYANILLQFYVYVNTYKHNSRSAMIISYTVAGLWHCIPESKAISSQLKQLASTHTSIHFHRIVNLPAFFIIKQALK